MSRCGVLASVATSPATARLLTRLGWRPWAGVTPATWPAFRLLPMDRVVSYVLCQEPLPLY